MIRTYIIAIVPAEDWTIPKHCNLHLKQLSTGSIQSIPKASQHKPSWRLEFVVLNSIVSIATKTWNWTWPPWKVEINLLWNWPRPKLQVIVEAPKFEHWKNRIKIYFEKIKKLVESYHIYSTELKRTQICKFYHLPKCHPSTHQSRRPSQQGPVN